MLNACYFCLLTNTLVFYLAGRYDIGEVMGRSLRWRDVGIKIMVRTPDTVSRHIQEMVERVVTQFHPEKIILFGSHARGEGTADSDVDLLVVMDVSGSKRRQAVAIDLSLQGIPLPADIIVVTPRELMAHRDAIGSIIREAAHEGKVLYERAA